MRRYDYGEYGTPKLQLPVPDEEEFWNQFPRDPDRFRELVATSGVELAGECDSATLRRVRKRAVKGDEGGDQSAWEALLPKPPDGYYWLDWRGGPTMANWRYWKLWTDEIGYMLPRPE